MTDSLTYSNPVWSGYCADPFVLRHQGMYYAYGTGGDTGDAPLRGRHFVLLKSPDLVHWEPLGGALEPATGFDDAAHWAPEVTFSNGKFWMYDSAAEPGKDDSTQRLRVAVSDHPEGPFQDAGEKLLPDEGFSIDASPFQDPRDGRWYLFPDFARDYFEGRVGTGIGVVPLADDMMTPLEKPRPAVLPSADWHISARNRDHYGRVWETWHTVEGPHLIVKDGVYYCLYSGGAWQNESYGVAYAVADNPLGPWRDEGKERGPCFLKGVPGKIIGPGHNSVTIAPDGKTLVCVYHSWDAGHTGRRLCIDPIEWTPSGPHVTPTSEGGRLSIA